MEGALSKWTNVMKGWQYRWFVLDETAGLFSYYTSKEKMLRGVRRGCVRLRGAVIGIDDEDEATFTITVDDKTFHFQAQDSEERERWIRALEDTVLRHNQMRRISNRRRKIGGAVDIDEFDRKLAETDRYLQLMLNQTAALQEKNIEDNYYDEVISSALEMTESIKHAIVLLQIAKNASLPQNSSLPKDFTTHGGSSTPTKGHQQRPSSHPQKEDPPLVVINKNTIEDTLLDIQTGIELGAECKEHPKQKSPKQVKKEKPPLITSNSLKPNKSSSVIPEISYSSSEDEDFFDAEDDHKEPESKKTVENPIKDTSDDTDLSVPLKIDTEIAKPLQPEMVVSPLTPGPDNIDYDALYDGSELVDEGEMDMKNHGSVITHLLSQVRIGMDLTKIVLPTFILERRSLLEMYSDFFAHPDIFIEIAKGSTPEERMVSVLRWYLSSFHAGRRSSIAKKPYNPILGETFSCHWKVPNPNDDDSNTDIAQDGPLPWAKDNDLVFVAEQVSHHPPISAFYAEHIKNRISVNAHIYTKSSFLGMSVAVHNIGQGCVKLLDYGEEYIATFPVGYGRSILTVPWIELGGKVTITCPQTNYHATVDFKCKQFFSSDVNKIAAELFAPNVKKPILKVEGEWNGRMVGKWANGKQEVFVDVNQIPIQPKICKKVSEQQRNESRRLWKDVTYNLKEGDIEKATAAKFALEQKQREEAASRKESGVKWETKLFKQIGEHWEFTKPLSQRIDK